jgi:hypothetical protein
MKALTDFLDAELPDSEPAAPAPAGQSIEQQGGKIIYHLKPASKGKPKP